MQSFVRYCGLSVTVPALVRLAMRSKKPKFYAVLIGRTPGIYHSWPECENQIRNFPGCLHKSFKSEDEAQAWLALGPPVRSATKVRTPKKKKVAGATGGDPFSPLPVPVTPAQLSSSLQHLNSSFSPFSQQNAASFPGVDHHGYAVNAEDIPLAFYIKGALQKKKPARKGGVAGPPQAALAAPPSSAAAGNSSARYVTNAASHGVDPAALSLSNLQTGGFQPNLGGYHGNPGGFSGSPSAAYQGGLGAYQGGGSSWQNGGLRFSHNAGEGYDDDQHPWGIDRGQQQPHPSHQSGYPPHQHAPRSLVDGLQRARVDPNMKYHLEFDGASRGNPGRSGAGAVLKDPWGKELYRITEGIAHGTCNYAEYRALVAGLQVALSLGVRKIHVQGDSNLVVMQSQGKWKVKTEGLAALAAEAKSLLKSFEDAEIVHVERAYNTLADMLSNQACDLADGRRQIVEMKAEDVPYDAFAHIK